MRKPKETKQKVDLLKPVTILDGSAGDCFGTEFYNPQDKDCSICADIEICGIKFQGIIQKKKTDFEQKHGPLLDQTDFDSVNMAKIEELAIKYEEEGEPLLFQELVDAVSDLARTKDDIAVIEYLKRTIPTTNLILKEGKVYARRKDSSN
jgi:uncharacterized Fe-S cluster-containing radical SAM superfamily enzyme